MHVHQADFVRLGNDVRGMDLPLITLRRTRADLPLGELAGERTQFPLLIGQAERDTGGDTTLDYCHDLPLLPRNGGHRSHGVCFD